MKKIIQTISIAILAVLSFGCASTDGAASGEAPLWVVNYRSVYPSAEFIAQRGEGANREDAIADADARIARYIQTEVDSHLTSSTNTIVTGAGAEAVASKEISTQNRTEISSTVTLLNVENPVSYFDKANKTWYAMAVINREEAWNRFVPQLEDARTAFNASFSRAQAENEPLVANVYLRNAWESGKLFLEKLEYARIISDQKEAAYKTDRENIAKIPALLLQNNLESTLALAVTGDNGSIISEAVTTTFSELGLTVAKSAPRYTLEVAVNDNETGSADTVYKIYPDVSIHIVGRTGKTVYSYIIKWNEANGKAAGSLDRAERLAFPVLAERIRKELSADFKARMGIK